ncbi:MAG: hypothetical protein M3R51_07330 [Candidatus Eremiobacteraeota bacterium]|nr:hypothetical protein [Candidatus Eremiobacteraeota bacterium]
MFRKRNGHSSVDYLLSTLSPQEVARSATAYAAARDRKIAIGEIRRAAARMAPDERAQFALSTGWNVPSDRDAFPIVDPTLSADALVAEIDREPERAVDCFAAFLEQNPRTIHALDPSSVREILTPVIRARHSEAQQRDAFDSPYTNELLEALPGGIRPRLQKLPPVSAKKRAIALGALTVTVLVVLFAWSTRSVNSHQSDTYPTTVAALVRQKHPALRHLRHATTAAHRPRPHKSAAVIRPHHHATARALSPRRIATVPSRRPAGAKWKFAPNRNPFIHETSFVRTHSAAAKVVRSASVLVAKAEPQMVQRARTIVSSYLSSIRSGDTGGALASLGLKPDAPLSNLSESTILAGRTGFRIVESALRDGAKSAKVDVEISSQRGRYFGVYTVVADGTSARIAEHTIIPETPRLRQ